MSFRRFLGFPPKAEPARPPRVTAAPPPSDKVSDVVDERTAEAAQMVLDNGAFERVMKRLRGQRLAEFSNADPANLPAIMEARYGIAALDKIRDDIQALADQTKVDRAKKRDE